MIIVDRIPLGDAAKRLSEGDESELPASTLRFWADGLESEGVHKLGRNDRDERVFEEIDLEIFKYVKDLRKEYGRKTTTKDVAAMVLEKFGDRCRRDVNMEMLHQVVSLEKKDKEKALQELINGMITTAGANILEPMVVNLRRELREELKKEMQEQMEELKSLELQRHEKMDELLEQMKSINEYNNLGFFQKLFNRKNKS